MEDLNARERKKLKGLAHHLNPIVIVGQNGVTDAVVTSMNQALESHELIKLKFNDCKEKKHELVQMLSQKSKSHFVGLIGNVAIFYKANPDEAKRKINL